MPEANPQISKQYRSTTDSLLDAILTELNGLSALGSGTAATEVSGGTAVISGTVEAFSDKRYVAFEWQFGATGSVIIDGVTYTINDMLPLFIDLGTTGYHRTINVDATGATQLVVNYLDKA